MGDCIIAATALANQAAILSDGPHFDVIQETKRNWIQGLWAKNSSVQTVQPI
jgi:predicted nucleic acid-binding protein